VQVKEREGTDPINHVHELSRINLQVCNTCGNFIVTKYTKTKTGRLVREEIELDLKIKSSRVYQLQTAMGQVKGLSKESHDAARIIEETSW
jgi:hypothetical protein